MNPTSPAHPCVLPNPKEPGKRKAHAGMTKRELFYMYTVHGLVMGLNASGLTDRNVDDKNYETLVKHADSITDNAFKHYEHGESVTQAELSAARRELAEMRAEMQELRALVKSKVPILGGTE